MKTWNIVVFFVLLVFSSLSLLAQGNEFVDADNDLMDDAWEERFGLRTDLNDAGDDLDGDGFSNLLEFAGDSLPNDITSLPDVNVALVDFEDEEDLNAIEVLQGTAEIAEGSGTRQSNALLLTPDSSGLVSIALEANFAGEQIAFTYAETDRNEKDEARVRIIWNDRVIEELRANQLYDSVTNTPIFFNVKQQRIIIQWDGNGSLKIDNIAFLTVGENNHSIAGPASTEFISYDENEQPIFLTDSGRVADLSRIGNRVAYSIDSGIYIRDLITRTTRKIFNEDEMRSGSFSWDGRYFIFILEESRKLFIYDYQDESLIDVFEKISERMPEEIKQQAFLPNPIVSARMSTNGRYVSISTQHYLDGNISGVPQRKVFTWDRKANRVTRDSVAEGESSSDESDGGSSWGGVLSANGRQHIFLSSVMGLTQEMANEDRNIFIKDRKTGEIVLVNRDTDNTVRTDTFINVNGPMIAFDATSANFLGSKDMVRSSQYRLNRSRIEAIVLRRDLVNQETIPVPFLRRDIEIEGATNINPSRDQTIGNRYLVSTTAAHEFNIRLFSGSTKALGRHARMSLGDLVDGTRRYIAMNPDGMAVNVRPGNISADGRFFAAFSPDPKIIPGFFTERPPGEFLVLMTIKEETGITDSDMDGVPDFVDDFPEDENEFVDSDWDGVGDVLDSDDDNDELPDQWELDNNLNPFDRYDADEDADGDGATNREEYIAGTDPQIPSGVKFDYDGDGKADIAVRRPGNFFQYILNSDDSSITREQFGRDVNDIPVSGDFDGDGKADVAVRRPSNKFWYIKNSSDDAIQRVKFGLQESDIPVPADYDNDGVTDIAVRRPADFTWYILQSSDSEIRRVVFGRQEGDIPVPADYDGDGVIDIAVRRPSNQTWYVLNSSGIDPIDGNRDGISRVRFGRQEDDIPVPADYDGDGKVDIAVRRPSNQTWYILNSSDGEIQRILFGRQEADIPIPADYDGDGKTDVAVRRPSAEIQFILNSSNGEIQRIQFGRDPGDIPIAAPVNTRINLAIGNKTLPRYPGEDYPLIDVSFNSEFEVQFGVEVETDF